MKNREDKFYRQFAFIIGNSTDNLLLLLEVYSNADTEKGKKIQFHSPDERT